MKIPYSPTLRLGRLRLVAGIAAIGLLSGCATYYPGDAAYATGGGYGYSQSSTNYAQPVYPTYGTSGYAPPVSYYDPYPTQQIYSQQYYGQPYSYGYAPVYPAAGIVIQSGGNRRDGYRRDDNRRNDGRRDERRGDERRTETPRSERPGRDDDRRRAAPAPMTAPAPAAMPDRVAAPRPAENVAPAGVRQLRRGEALFDTRRPGT